LNLNFIFLNFILNYTVLLFLFQFYFIIKNYFKVCYVSFNAYVRIVLGSLQIFLDDDDDDDDDDGFRF